MDRLLLMLNGIEKDGRTDSMFGFGSEGPANGSGVSRAGAMVDLYTATDPHLNTPRRAARAHY